jgi:hypothetical protein
MKKKLKINDLKVQSFVTEMKNENFNTIVGGARSNNPHCPIFLETVHGQGCAGQTLVLQVCGPTQDYSQCGTGVETIICCAPTAIC